MTIRVLLADDQALIRAGFAAIVDSADDMEVVGQAIDGADAVRQAGALRPDVVLMDVRMPGLDGIESCRQITADEDNAGVRVLVLTTFEQDDYVVDAMRAGASGFLGKSTDPNALLDAVRTVAHGDALLSPQATRAVIRELLTQPHTPAFAVNAQAIGQLTERELEIVTLVASGLSNDEIADQLFLSPLTVKTHVNRAMVKIGARDRAQLVVAAYRSGIAPLDQ